MIDNIVHQIVSHWMGKILVGGIAVITSIRYVGGIYAYIETEKLERPSYTVVKTLPDRVEIRHYEPYMIAETVVDGSYGWREAGRQGFGNCAGYIFGKNIARRNKQQQQHHQQHHTPNNGSQQQQQSQRGNERNSNSNNEVMAMTAPVRVDGSIGGSNNRKTRVSFVIGKDYTMKTVPKPLEDDRVRIRWVPSHTLAVRTFSGPPPPDERVLLERKRLESVLAQANIPIKGRRNGRGRGTDGATTTANEDTTTLVYGYHDPFITPNILRRNEVAVLLEGSV